MVPHHHRQEALVLVETTHPGCERQTPKGPRGRSRYVGTRELAQLTLQEALGQRTGGQNEVSARPCTQGPRGAMPPGEAGVGRAPEGPAKPDIFRIYLDFFAPYCCLIASGGQEGGKRHPRQWACNSAPQRPCTPPPRCPNPRALAASTPRGTPTRSNAATPSLTDTRTISSTRRCSLAVAKLVPQGPGDRRQYKHVEQAFGERFWETSFGARRHPNMFRQRSKHVF
jgi:hypothetical protein